jgi:hypothetical protein
LLAFLNRAATDCTAFGASTTAFGVSTPDLRFSIYFKISSFVTRPSFPEPAILSNSATEIPSSLAIFFTSGEKNLSDPENPAEQQLFL